MNSHAIHYINVILLIIIFYINHKKDLLKRIPILLGIWVVVFIIFALVFKDWSVRLAYLSFGVSAAIDLFVVSLNKRKH